MHRNMYLFFTINIILYYFFAKPAFSNSAFTHSSTIICLSVHVLFPLSLSSWEGLFGPPVSRAMPATKYTQLNVCWVKQSRWIFLKFFRKVSFILAIFSTQFVWQTQIHKKYLEETYFTPVSKLWYALNWEGDSELLHFCSICTLQKFKVISIDMFIKN